MPKAQVQNVKNCSGTVKATLNYTYYLQLPLPQESGIEDIIRQCPSEKAYFKLNDLGTHLQLYPAIGIDWAAITNWFTSSFPQTQWELAQHGSTNPPKLPPALDNYLKTFVPQKASPQPLPSQGPAAAHPPQANYPVQTTNPWLIGGGVMSTWVALAAGFSLATGTTAAAPLALSVGLLGINCLPVAGQAIALSVAIVALIACVTIHCCNRRQTSAPSVFSGKDQSMAMVGAVVAQVAGPTPTSC